MKTTKIFTKNSVSTNNLRENKIRARAHRLWLESSDYHEPAYYWEKAKHQIEVEEQSIEFHRWYSPRKWTTILEKKYLNTFSEQLKKCSLLNILQQITVLSVLVGAVTFVTEADRRHQELRMVKKINLLEMINEEKVPDKLISDYLRILNDREPAFVKFLDFPRYLKLAKSRFDGEKIYVFNKKERSCQEIYKMQLFPPRWESIDFLDFKFPKPLNLVGAELCGAEFRQATLEEAILNHANLAGANFHEAKLANAKLRNTDLRESSIVRADLTDADLEDADLTDADLTDADLTGANLTGANLTGAYLNLADLTDADLTGADLTGADLTDADLTGADLTNVDLIGANLTDVKLDEIKINHLTKSQLQLACNWDKAHYIYREASYKRETRQELNPKENYKYIEQIRQDKFPDSQKEVDCSKWQKKSQDTPADKVIVEGEH